MTFDNAHSAPNTKVHFFWLNEHGPVGMSVGVSILSTELTAAGYDVWVSHISTALGYPFDSSVIARDICDFNADVFALSFASAQFGRVAELVRIIKKQRPGAIVICGGVHAIVSPETVIEIPGVDAVCTGEADGIFAMFLDRMKSGDAWEKTRGFHVRRNGLVHRNPPAPLPDITNQSPLNFGGIDYKTLVRHKSGFAEILLGRGCGLRCAFCQNHIFLGKHRSAASFVRMRGIDNLMREMKEFQRVAGSELKGFIFGDDSIAYGKDLLAEFLLAYKREIDMPFVACLQATQVSRPMAVALRDAGCNVIRIGVETGSDRLRMGLLRKPVSNQSLFRASRQLHEADINVQGFGMLALPGETPDDIMCLLRLAVDLRLDVFRMSTFLPLPQTELHGYCLENNLMKKTTGHHDFSSESVLKWPPPTALFHEKIRLAFPLIMNSMLPGAASELYAEPAGQVLNCKRSSWPALSEQIPQKTAGLHAQASSSSLPHYYSPVSDRPDYAFLFLPDRKRKMINIDDAR